MKEGATGPMLEGIRVLDLSDERGMVCGWMLAELGADVVAIEPPAGSAARRVGPFSKAGADPNGSLVWWSHARNKRSAVVDATSLSGVATLRELAARADVWIESDTPGALAARGLGYEDLARVNPRLVYTSITPFGQTGPKAQWKATDLTVLAAGGPLALTGDADRAPVRVSVPQAFAHAGAEAAAATLVALHERHASGLGQHVDVSAQQAVTLATQSDIVSAGVGDEPAVRVSGGLRVGPMIVRLVFPARDGYVSITHVFGAAIGPATARLMRRVCADGFCDETMRDKDWIGYGGLILSGAETIADFEAAKSAVAAWTASKTKAELLREALEHDLLIAPASTAADVVASEQLASRGFFEVAPRPDGAGTAPQLGPFARFSGWSPGAPRPAPSIGEHTGEILAELEASPPPAVGAPRAGTPARALEGLKVLDLMWAIAGPMATRFFADHGATVVRIESQSRIDVCRTMRPYVGGVPDLEQSSLFHSCNASKRMVALDLSKPEARPVIEDLVRWADVVCESFSPGTIDELGFGYERLREIDPSIIMLSTALMGQSGPLKRYAGYGNLAAAISGFFDLTGWPDRAPAGPFGAYTDYIAPKFSATALLAALEHRRRTGEGQHIDMSQAEAALHFLGPALLDHTVNGAEPTRAGNRDGLYAPHGCYPCGDGDWIAIAVDGDEEFRALCDEVGVDGLADDARFRTATGRRDAADALDETLARATAGRDASELEAKLQARGVAAHVVLGAAALVEEPQLVARGHFVAREGGAIVEASRSRLSRTPAVVGDGLPLIGRDTHAVLTEVLGYDDERITQLAIAGVLE